MFGGSQILITQMPTPCGSEDPWMTCTSSTVANFNSLANHYPQKPTYEIIYAMARFTQQVFNFRNWRRIFLWNKALILHWITFSFFQSKTNKLVWNPVWDLQTVLYIFKVGWAVLTGNLLLPTIATYHLYNHGLFQTTHFFTLPISSAAGRKMPPHTSVWWFWANSAKDYCRTGISKSKSLGAGVSPST